jgi:CubicO group peptidase (beta-lactamase class C family)
MFRAYLLVVLCFFTAAAQNPPADIDAWVERSMKEFEVPGMAVGVVKNGKLVMAKGYGVRKLGEPGRVDEHTLFGIASNSKAFTAATVAILVDDGKLAWDDPVAKHLRGMELADPLASRELRVRDLLCHRTGLGLGAGDLLFWPDTDVTRDQVVRAARQIAPASSFRSRYAYNNLTFVVAGQVVEAVSGKPWDDFVRERIFGPIGMTESDITAVRFKPGDNVAMPHSRGWRLEGTLTPITPTRDETWAAAAGIKSNLVDLSKWAVTQLNAGKTAEGKRVWSEKASEEMWSAQTIVPIRTPSTAGLKPTKPNFSAYGLGWSLRDYRGRKIVSHGGALTGMVTTVVLVPEEQIGIILLTNQEENGAYSAVLYRLLDHYLGAAPSDWIAAYKASREDMMSKAIAAEKKQADERARNSKPSLELSKYAGDYADRWYGKATIADESGKLTMRMSRTPAMVGDLEHWQYDTFKVIWRDKTIPDAFVTFTLNYQGKIDHVKMAAVSTLADFSFDYQDLDFRPIARPAR